MNRKGTDALCVREESKWREINQPRRKLERENTERPRRIENRERD